jgi:hypothetical protein
MPADEFDKRDEDKDLELDLMAEQELLRLTRQYRVRYSNCNISQFRKPECCSGR